MEAKGSMAERANTIKKQVIYAGGDQYLGTTRQTDILNIQRIERNIFGQPVGGGGLGRLYLDGGVVTKIFMDAGEGIWLMEPNKVQRDQLDYYQNWGGLDGGFVQEYLGEVRTDAGKLVGFRQSAVDGQILLSYLGKKGVVTTEMAEEFLTRLRNLYKVTGMAHGDLYFGDNEAIDYANHRGRWTPLESDLNLKNIMVTNEDGDDRRHLVPIDYGQVRSNVTPEKEYETVQQELIMFLAKQGNGSGGVK